MPLEICLSEEGGDFKPHKNLLDPPYLLDTPLVKCGIFYLGCGQSLGADSFRVNFSENFAISLLNDMEGHGQNCRQKLVPFFDGLDQLARLGASQTYAAEDLAKLVASMDNKADSSKHNFFTLSYIRILADRSAEYLNEGENDLIICSNGTGVNLTQISHGKIGLLKLTVGSEQDIISKISPYRQQMHSGDRIFVCSDGVTEYLGESGDKSRRISEIVDLLLNQESLESALTEINMQAYERLQSINEPLADDYTFIALEVK